jgi:hypothetical protein
LSLPLLELMARHCWLLLLLLLLELPASQRLLLLLLLLRGLQQAVIPLGHS